MDENEVGITVFGCLNGGSGTCRRDLYVKARGFFEFFRKIIEKTCVVYRSGGGNADFGGVARSASEARHVSGIGLCVVDKVEQRFVVIGFSEVGYQRTGGSKTHPFDEAVGSFFVDGGL